MDIDKRLLIEKSSVKMELSEMGKIISICELCYCDAPDGDLPSEWDIVLQSLICPSCKARAKAEGLGITTMFCGMWATREDPRAALVEAVEP